MKKIGLILGGCLSLAAIILGLAFWISSAFRAAVIIEPEKEQTELIIEVGEIEKNLALINQEEAISFPKKENGELDKIATTKQLSNPPEIIKAVYATSWSASSSAKMDYFIDLIANTELNAIVIDIKDYSGQIAYEADLEEAIEYGAVLNRIRNIDVLIDRLHQEEIYVIGRLTVFQDPILAKARPDLAIYDEITGNVWVDYKNLAWIDPLAKEAWDYNIALAKDALNRGFDEINFDYIRFPSDGPLQNMVFPFYDQETQSKREALAEFFSYLRQELKGYKISADLFGLAAIRFDDLGIGQIIEDAYEYFDFVSPMVYPSHYSSGFLGYKNPALYPYEVVKYSMDLAFGRLKNYELTKSEMTVDQANRQNSKLRPWLQDFNLGAIYDEAMVNFQIQAVYDAFCEIDPEPLSSLQACDPLIDNFVEQFNGWMLWNPQNIYTREALEKTGY